MFESGLMIARECLRKGFFHIDCLEPFTLTSGLLSPVLWDGQGVLSDPLLRQLVVRACVARLPTDNSVHTIASVPTGGIALSAMVASTAGLGLLQPRKIAKVHGLRKSIEGGLIKGKGIYVYEDVFTRGVSALEVVRQLQAAGGNVLACTAMYAHNSTMVERTFWGSKVAVASLVSFEDIIRALREVQFPKDTIDEIKTWQRDPEKWSELRRQK